LPNSTKDQSKSTIIQLAPGRRLHVEDLRDRLPYVLEQALFVFANNDAEIDDWGFPFDAWNILLYCHVLPNRMMNSPFLGVLEYPEALSHDLARRINGN
jgi:hypothetical protein